MLKRFLVSAFILLPAIAGAQQAPAPSGDAAYEMSCSLFHHNADGSWNATRSMTLKPASGPIPLKPKFRFRTGTLFAGFDLAAALDGACAR